MKKNKNLYLKGDVLRVVTLEEVHKDERLSMGLNGALLSLSISPNITKGVAFYPGAFLSNKQPSIVVPWATSGLLYLGDDRIGARIERKVLYKDKIYWVEQGFVTLVLSARIYYNI